MKKWWKIQTWKIDSETISCRSSTMTNSTIKGQFGSGLERTLKKQKKQPKELFVPWWELSFVGSEVWSELHPTTPKVSIISHYFYFLLLLRLTSTNNLFTFYKSSSFFDWSCDQLSNDNCLRVQSLVYCANWCGLHLRPKWLAGWPAFQCIVTLVILC